MKTFPLQSLTIIEAQQKQFALVDSICRHFPGSEFLTGGDLGLTRSESTAYYPTGGAGAG